MPPPREPSGPNKGRRRQESMPGGWLWLVILLVLAVFLYFTLGFQGGGMIDYTEFMQIAKDQLFIKVTIVGDDRAIGELKNNAEEKLKEEVKKQVRSNRLATNIPGGKQAVEPMTRELRDAK